MYDYIKQWPVDRENGWSHKMQGVCTDTHNWFFTQNGRLWKFPVKHRLADKVTKANPAEGIKKKYYGFHLGDLDYSKGFLFVPVTGDGKPYIAVFSSETLSYVTKQVILRPDGKFFDSLSWCAINPKDGKLYTTDRHVGPKKVYQDYDQSPFLVYDVDYDKIKTGSCTFLEYRASISPYERKITSNGWTSSPVSFKNIQGGCFDYEYHLHTTNGTNNSFAKSKKGGIFVFDMPRTVAKDGVYAAERIAYSTQKGTFRFQFNGTGDEPEGITYWDLNNGQAPEIKGVLHAIMCNYVGSGDDDFFFKHYDRV